MDTHIGKRRPVKKKEELFECANRHLRNEIEVLKPKLVVIASRLACEFFWGERKKLKEFLEDQKKSIEQDGRLFPLPGFSFDTAIFPNPSPKNGWKGRYYENYNLGWVKKIVQDFI